MQQVKKKIQTHVEAQGTTVVRLLTHNSGRSSEICVHKLGNNSTLTLSRLSAIYIYHFYHVGIVHVHLIISFPDYLQYSFYFYYVGIVPCVSHYLLLTTITYVHGVHMHAW